MAEAQIKGNRIAVLCYSRSNKVSDIFVLNLATGQKLFSCSEDLHVNVSDVFLLERERILIWTNEIPRKILSLNFWVK
jgi:hypothetical protein